MRVLIVGCGYVGLPLGAELVRLGHEVHGVRRTRDGEAELAAAGIRPLVADVTSPAALQQLPGPYDWVVNCVSSGKGGVADYRKTYLAGTRNLIECFSDTPPRKFVYTSSTSVYGQTDGSTVDESSPAKPDTETGAVLVETENLLITAARERNFPAVILRAAGIYGPGRGHLFQQFLKNEAKVSGDGGRFINMIHRDDLAGAIIAALQNGRPGEIYNAVDDEPVEQIRFFRWLAETLRRPLPPFASETDNAPRKRGLTDKQVQNRRLKAELGYEFKHPNFRAGYAAEIRRLDLSV